MAVKTVQVVINGQTHDLVYNPGTGLYEATINAPDKSSFNEAGGYYGVTVIAEDDAGNRTEANDTDGTLGEDLKLYVKETTVPVITITSPTDGAFLQSNTPTITWTVTDDDSGVDPDSITITVNSEAPTKDGITKNPTAGGYDCSYTIPVALSEGANVIKIDAADNDGNNADQKTVNFTVDTVVPELVITAPAEGLVTNNNEITVSGTTNDVTSAPVTLTVDVNGDGPQDVLVDAGSFTTTVQLRGGSNTITIVATDKAGKTTMITRTVTVDTGGPIINSVSITPNPVTAGGTITIAVSVTD